VRLSAVAGKFSNESRFSSPDPPLRWPSRMRAAVIVVTLMPSPRNTMTFFACAFLGAFASAEAAPARNHQSGVSPSG
jgi:hypothetical protein